MSSMNRKVRRLAEQANHPVERFRRGWASKLSIPFRINNPAARHDLAMTRGRSRGQSLARRIEAVLAVVYHAAMNAVYSPETIRHFGLRRVRCVCGPGQGHNAAPALHPL